MLQQIPFYRQGVLATSVQGMAGSTPYIVVGNDGFLGLGVLMLAGDWFMGRRRRAA